MDWYSSARLISLILTLFDQSLQNWKSKLSSKKLNWNVKLCQTMHWLPSSEHEIFLIAFSRFFFFPLILLLLYFQFFFVFLHRIWYPTTQCDIGKNVSWDINCRILSSSTMWQRNNGMDGDEWHNFYCFFFLVVSFPVTSRTLIVLNDRKFILNWRKPV